MPFAGLGRSRLLPSLGRRLLRFLGVFGGAALIISGKLNLTFFSAHDVLISVDVNLRSVDVNSRSVAVNAVLGFFVAALFRISTHPWTVSGLLSGSYK